MLFSCISKARKAVKRTSEFKFSYIEQTLMIEISDLNYSNYFN